MVGVARFAYNAAEAGAQGDCKVISGGGAICRGVVYNASNLTHTAKEGLSAGVRGVDALRVAWRRRGR